MGHIDDVHARQIFDSRGNPTIEVDVRLGSGVLGRAAVPAGTSTGEREAVELRDHGAEFSGRGVRRAIRSVNSEIREAVRGHGVADQAGIDRLMIELDGTADKSRLGANAIVGVSLACARAAAAEAGVPLWRHLAPEDADPVLPMPMLNVLNGGAHADNQIDVQEYMIVPVGATSLAEALRMSVETYAGLRTALRERGLATSLGDEGGFAPALDSNEAPLELLVDAITRAGYQPGRDVALAIDPAASAIFADGRYRFASDGRSFSPAEMVGYWEQLVDGYPIVSLEDAMGEDDWSGWQALTSRLGQRLQLVGDDIFVTNPGIITRAIQEEIANAVLIKPNQIGTLTETLHAIDVAQEAGYLLVISHRSGDTEDTFIADLAVATGAGQIKTGAPARSERVAKYNRLLQIEEELGPAPEFASMAQVSTDP